MTSRRGGDAVALPSRGRSRDFVTRRGKSLEIWGLWRDKNLGKSRARDTSLFRFVGHRLGTAAAKRICHVHADRQPAQAETRQLSAVEPFMKKADGDQELQRRSDVLQEANGRKL